MRGGIEESEHACLLSNGVYSLRVKSDGQSAAFLGDTCVYRPEEDSPGLSIMLGDRPLLPGGTAGTTCPTPPT